jgi:hypothetical protein
MTEQTTGETLPRETGQEKAPSTCANCGAEVGVVEAPYGGTAPANCPKCYPATDPANARQQAGAGSSSVPRELGSAVPTPPSTGGPDA